MSNDMVDAIIMPADGHINFEVKSDSLCIKIKSTDESDSKYVQMCTTSRYIYDLQTKDTIIFLFDTGEYQFSMHIICKDVDASIKSRYIRGEHLATVNIPYEIIIQYPANVVKKIIAIEDNFVTAGTPIALRHEPIVLTK